MSEGRKKSALNEFIDLVNSVEDVELLGVAQGLMLDIATIANLKEKLELLETNLMTEERAPFYLFTIDLDEDEKSFASDAVKGRVRFLHEKEDRRRLREEARNAANETAELEEVSESVEEE